jgi:hypothetical protein
MVRARVCGADADGEEKGEERQNQRPAKNPPKNRQLETEKKTQLIKTMDKLCACTADIIIDVVAMAIGRVSAAIADRTMYGSSSGGGGACDRGG